MIAYYANPHCRRPFWRVREDDGLPRIHVRDTRYRSGLRSIKPLDRHLLLLGKERDRATVVVYVAVDDSEAHWQIFLLVAAVALVVAIKHFVEKGVLSKEPA